VTMGDQNVCEAAAVVVTADCPVVCGGCTAVASGCSEEPIFVRKYEAQHAPVPVHKDWATMAGLVALSGVTLVGVVIRRTSRAPRAIYADVLLLEEQA